MRVGVGFDFDHTLGIGNKLERIAFLRLLEPIAARGGHALGSLVDETERIDALLTLQRSGACSIEDAVRRFVRERGVADTESLVERFIDISLSLVDQLVIPMPDTGATLAALRSAGVTVAILTNGWEPLQTRKALRAGFDGPIVVSSEIGAQKPDPAAFSALLGVLGVPADRAWYVGDDPRTDIAGAIGAGLRGVWLDPEHLEYPAGVVRPTHTIHRLAEIVALVTQNAAAAPAKG